MTQRENPFYWMYGPTKTALAQPTTPYQIDVQDYRTELLTHLSDAWAFARDNIAQAQAKQKRDYIRLVRSLIFRREIE